MPVLGVLPYLHGLALDAEDAIASGQTAPTEGALQVLVPLLPRISNHTDFDPLRAHPQVSLRYLRAGDAWPGADLVILPGSKNVRADLAFLRAQGWDRAIRRHLRYGGRLLGICGGLQMLGRKIADPNGVEGAPGSSPGLGLLELVTTLGPEKRLANVRGHLLPDKVPVHGYEIHAGISHGPALDWPLVRLDDGRHDGASSDDDQILATYLHGLFESAASLTALLAWAGQARPQPLDPAALREAAIERLADACAAHLDLAHIEQLLRSSTPGTA